MRSLGSQYSIGWGAAEAAHLPASTGGWAQGLSTGMGFLQSWKSRAKGLHEEDGAQRSNSVTLPRKPAFVVADSEADGRYVVLLKQFKPLLP